MIETLVVVGVVVVLTDWYLRYKWWRRRGRTQSSVAEVLAMRYARGEINREEYLQKRDDIHTCPSLIHRSGAVSSAA
jgi:uncharacterized membrane protein